MKESTKNNFLLPLMVAFIVVFILSPIANAFFDPKKKEIPFVTPVLKLFSFIWNNILNYKLSIWIFLLLIFIIGFIIYIVKIKTKKTIPVTIPIEIIPEIIKPNYLRYTEDVLKYWKWNWKYKTDDLGKTYLIEDLRPVCNNCKMKTIKSDFNFLFNCPNCDQVYNTMSRRSEDIDKIIALIKYKIENKLY